MSVKDIVALQYRSKVNSAAEAAADIAFPPEGWICTVRKALKMSAADVARRLKKTRALVSQTEKAELDGGVTIKTMKNMAEAMGCHFVYAIVPDETIEQIIEKHAHHKAQKLVQKTSEHMALEAQELSSNQMADEVVRIRDELLRDMPSDFWRGQT